MIERVNKVLKFSRKSKITPGFEGYSIEVPSQEVQKAYEHCASICKSYARYNWTHQKSGPDTAKELAELMIKALWQSSLIRRKDV